VRVTVALIGFFAFLILHVTTPQMTPLFTEPVWEDSASIAKELDRGALPRTAERRHYHGAAQRWRGSA